jgi:hypothetical protein
MDVRKSGELSFKTWISHSGEQPADGVLKTGRFTRFRSLECHSPGSKLPAMDLSAGELNQREVARVGRDTGICSPDGGLRPFQGLEKAAPTREQQAGDSGPLVVSARHVKDVSQILRAWMLA